MQCSDKLRNTSLNSSTSPGWHRMFILGTWKHDVFQILWSFHVPIRAMDCAPCAMNSPLSTLKNGSNLARILDFVLKIWLFLHPESAILPLERLPGGWASSNRRIAASGSGKHHIFSTKSQIFVEFDSFSGVQSGKFMYLLRAMHGANRYMKRPQNLKNVMDSCT